MADSLPYSLTNAHRQLLAALDKAIGQFKEGGRWSNKGDVARGVKGFVDALHKFPGGGEELQRRARLVETETGKGSEYQAAYRAIHKNAKPRLYLFDIQREYDAALRTAGGDPMSHKARAAHQRWADACSAVERQAGELAVDGCWWLFYIHEASYSNASQRAEGARAILRSDMGGTLLKPIKRAAKAIMAWAREQPQAVVEARTEGSGGKAPPKRRGRKKADFETVEREAVIAADWKQARETGVYKPDFAKAQGMTARQLNALLTRVRKRISRAD